jgi:hypothetical protein
MLQAQLLAAQTSSEVAGYVQQMKAVMLGNGLQPGFRFYIAQLRAAVRMHDVQVSTAGDLGGVELWISFFVLPDAVFTHCAAAQPWQPGNVAANPSLRLSVSSCQGSGFDIPCLPHLSPLWCSLRSRPSGRCGIAMPAHCKPSMMICWANCCWS